MNRPPPGHNLGPFSLEMELPGIPHHAILAVCRRIVYGPPSYGPGSAVIRRCAVCGTKVWRSVRALAVEGMTIVCYDCLDEHAPGWDAGMVEA